MTTELLFVFALIVIAAVLMASNRVRFDIVALQVVIALMQAVGAGASLLTRGSSINIPRGTMLEASLSAPLTVQK